MALPGRNTSGTRRCCPGDARPGVHGRRLRQLASPVSAHADVSDLAETLEDPATAQRVDLESFGPPNSAVFARLLADAPAPPTR